VPTTVSAPTPSPSIQNGASSIAPPTTAASPTAIATTSADASAGVITDTRLGVQVGLNLANTSLNAPTTTRTGFAGGISLEQPLTDHIFFAPELTYSQMGDGMLVNGIPSTLEYDVIRLPLLLKYKLPFASNSPLRFFGFLGPSAAFRVKAQLSPNAPGPNVDVSATTSSVLLGADVGGGLEYGFDAHSCFFLSVRYIYGFTSLNHNFGPEMNERDVSFLTGVLFHF
jgi:hypothetical protein